MAACNYTVVSKSGFYLRQLIFVHFVVRGDGTVGNCWLVIGRCDWPGLAHDQYCITAVIEKNREQQSEQIRDEEAEESPS